MYGKKKIIYAITGSAIILTLSVFLYYFYILRPLNDNLIKASQNLFVKKNIYQASALLKRRKPPKRTVYGIYLTAFSAGHEKKIDSLIGKIKKSKINAVVIDIKDYTGYLSYDSQLPMVQELGLKKIKIKDLPALLKKFHDENIYVIARVAVFQDPALSAKRPGWAVLNKGTGGIWRDRKGLSWLDPANPKVWDYHIDIAKEAIALGFDEINLDYIRFPSDGNISLMKFPQWTDGDSKAEVIKKFFSYFHEALKDEPAYLSADLFGMTTTALGDLNIGQVLQNTAPYFDFICPMVYPSHYPTGYLKFKNPALHPYEVIFNDIKTANRRIASTTDAIAIIRPWIQDFDLGADYTATMIKAEIKASEDAGGAGWTAWDPQNTYTWEAYK